MCYSKNQLTDDLHLEVWEEIVHIRVLPVSQDTHLSEEMSRKSDKHHLSTIHPQQCKKYRAGKKCSVTKLLRTQNILGA